MIKSMTGYGRAQGEYEGKLITIEIKAVNHRYFDFNVRCSRVYGYLDDILKSYINKKVARGKIDVYVNIEAMDDEPAEVLINKSLLTGYLNAFRNIAEEYNLENDISVSKLLQYNDIFTVKKPEDNQDVIINGVLSIAEKALSDFIKMRESEGTQLYIDITKRCKAIEEYVDEIKKRSPQIVAEYREKLYAKMKEILNDSNIDEQRILTEAAVFADKVTVAEELTRLKSHIYHMNEMLQSPKSIGKKLDFIVQEMNREVNTIGSKANDLAVSQYVVDIKSEIENIREQVQNIE